MWNKIILIIFLIFCIPNISYSQEQFTFIKKGEIAKIDGVLYSPAANGRILALIETSSKAFDLRLQHEKKQLELKYQRKIDILVIEKKFREKTYKEKNEILNQELLDNRKLIANPPIQWSNILIGTTVGVVVGAILGIVFVSKI